MATSGLRAKYAKVIRKLFPRGYAWDNIANPESNLYKLIEAYSMEVCRIQDRAKVLIDEVDPRSTLELLPDWERLLGLPDECDPATDQSIQERRTRIVQVLTTSGGQNAAFYENLALNFGFEVGEVEIVNNLPFTAGRAVAGDRLTNGPWKYAFIVKAPAEFLIIFKAGQGAAGDPLVKVGNDVLQCLMNKYKPAHTIVLFSFGSDEF